MADFSQDRAPVTGAWHDDERAHRELERREARVQNVAAERHRRVAEAAYRRAELRGFSPGYEEQDWYEAEKEIDALATAQHWDQSK